MAGGSQFGAGLRVVLGVLYAGRRWVAALAVVLLVVALATVTLLRAVGAPSSAVLVVVALEIVVGVTGLVLTVVLAAKALLAVVTAPQREQATDGLAAGNLPAPPASTAVPSEGDGSEEVWQ